MLCNTTLVYILRKKENENLTFIISRNEWSTLHPNLHDINKVLIRKILIKSDINNGHGTEINLPLKDRHKNKLN